MVVQLDVRDVSKRFGGVVANDRISLQVRKGEVVGLIGPNGSGKTTLFNSVIGHHPVDSGAVRFEDHDVIGWRVQAIARLGVLRTFQQTRTYRDMTCLENVTICLPQRHMRLSDLAWPLPRGTERRAREFLELIGLSHQANEMAGALSFGQRRLLELAMVLMGEPKLLLLDEPTAGINPSGIEALIERLRHMNRAFEITLVVIEHNMPVIMGLAGRIYCLNRGRVLAEGTPAQIQADPRVVDAYLGTR
jgi:ABC-type branched-subunit amino acid transport system ATPase component